MGMLKTIDKQINTLLSETLVQLEMLKTIKEQIKTLLNMETLVELEIKNLGLKQKNIYTLCCKSIGIPGIFWNSE